MDYCLDSDSHSDLIYSGWESIFMSHLKVVSTSHTRLEFKNSINFLCLIEGIKKFGHLCNCMGIRFRLKPGSENYKRATEKTIAGNQT